VTMTATIFERAFLPAAPADLYAGYLDPERHANIIGAGVSISAEPGSAFAAFDGQVRGRNLYLDPDRRIIVQSWGSDQLGPGHLVVLAFDAAEDDTEDRPFSSSR
jgi:activator of HSP90 ATPase